MHRSLRLLKEASEKINPTFCCDKPCSAWAGLHLWLSAPLAGLQLGTWWNAVFQTIATKKKKKSEKGMRDTCKTSCCTAGGRMPGSVGVQSAGSLWAACAQLVGSTWAAGGQRVGSVLAACGQSVGSVWAAHEQCVGSTWAACGQRVGSSRAACGQRARSHLSLWVHCTNTAP